MHKKLIYLVLAAGLLACSGPFNEERHLSLSTREKTLKEDFLKLVPFIPKDSGRFMGTRSLNDDDLFNEILLSQKGTETLELISAIVQGHELNSISELMENIDPELADLFTANLKNARFDPRTQTRSLLNTDVQNRGYMSLDQGTVNLFWGAAGTAAAGGALVRWNPWWQPWLYGVGIGMMGAGYGTMVICLGGWADIPGSYIKEVKGISGGYINNEYVPGYLIAGKMEIPDTHIPLWGQVGGALVLSILPFSDIIFGWFSSVGTWLTSKLGESGILALTTGIGVNVVATKMETKLFSVAGSRILKFVVAPSVAIGWTFIRPIEKTEGNLDKLTWMSKP